MPSDREWDNIRSLFQRMYVDEKKTLSEVRRFMDRRGFHATLKQYKNKITEWHLRKNNRHSDMEFAMRRLTKRQAAGKDTVFRLHGRMVTRNDVLRYWKRTMRQPSMNMSTEPRTPSEITYGSPDAMSDQFSDNQSTIFWNDASATNDLTTIQEASISQPYPRTLNAPGYMQDLELALWHASNYYALYAPHVSMHDITRLQNQRKIVSRFSQQGKAIGSCVASGNAPSVAEVLCLRCSAMVPEILELKDPSFLTEIFLIVGCYSRIGLRKLIKAFLLMLARQTFRFDGPNSPLFGLLIVLNQHQDLIIPLVERLLRLGVSSMTKLVGAKNLLTRHAAHILPSIYAANKSWHESYLAAKAEQDVYRAYTPQELGPNEQYIFLEMQTCMATAQGELGNSNEAIDLIQQNLLQFEKSMISRERLDELQCKLYIAFGDILVHTDFHGAIEAYEKALEIAKRDFTTNLCMGIKAAYHLKAALEMQSTVTPCSNYE